MRHHQGGHYEKAGSDVYYVSGQMAKPEPVDQTFSVRTSGTNHLTKFVTG
jgi:hypothetical protein